MSAMLTMAFLTAPSVSYCQYDYKTVDVSSKVSTIQQTSPSWCVYACLEAISGTPQCEYCGHYLGGYITSDYNNEYDPYPASSMTTTAYNYAMNDYVHGFSTPCDDDTPTGEFASFWRLVN
jgi:hypothetical protein